jgi:CO dehydrogenase/acetyl-CoA synthase beta subunit
MLTGRRGGEEKEEEEEEEEEEKEEEKKHMSHHFSSCAVELLEAHAFLLPDRTVMWHMSFECLISKPTDTH